MEEEEYMGDTFTTSFTSAMNVVRLSSRLVQPGYTTVKASPKVKRWEV